jgi:hypothetical protein
MATRAKTKTAGPADIIGNLKAQIDELQHQREDLREQRATVASAPRAFSEAAADIDRVVTATAERGGEIPIAWLASGVHGWADLSALLAPATLDPEYPPIAPAALLCRIIPTAVSDWLKRELEAAYQRLPDAMPATERTAALADIDRQIDSIDRELAALFWSAIDAGLELPLPEIPARALLGPDTAP